MSDEKTLRHDVALANRIIERFGLATAFADVRAATVAACFLEESAGLQMRMLAAAAGGDATRIRAFTREEAERAADETGPSVNAAARAWEYYAAVAEQKPLGG